jgi:hypothetical protein
VQLREVELPSVIAPTLIKVQFFGVDPSFWERFLHYLIDTPNQYLSPRKPYIYLHNNKRQELGTIDNKNIKIKLVSYDINKISMFIEQLKNGHITIERKRSRITINLGEQFSTASATKIDTSYSTNEERSGR